MSEKLTGNRLKLIVGAILILGIIGITYLIQSADRSSVSPAVSPVAITDQGLLLEVEALLSEGRFEEASALLANAPPNPLIWDQWRCVQQRIVGYSGNAWLAPPDVFVQACDTVNGASGEAPTSQVPLSQELQALYELAASDPSTALPQLQAYRVTSSEKDLLIDNLIAAIANGLESSEEAFVHAQVGQTFARYGNWPLAAASFEAALEIEPNYIEAMAYLGLAKDRAGGDGLNELLQAVESSEGAALPHLFLGMHWRMKNDLDSATASLETAFELDSSDPMIAAELGSVYLALGEYEAAEEAYRRATELAPTEPGFWLLLAQFSLEKEIEVDSLALPASRNALALEPEDPASYVALGYSHFLLNNTVIAERMFMRALELNPSYAQAHYHLGLLYLAEGNTELAIQFLESAIAADPESPAASRANQALERFAIED